MELLRIVSRYGVKITISPNITTGQDLIEIRIEKATKKGKRAAHVTNIERTFVDNMTPNEYHYINGRIKRMAETVVENIKNMYKHNL